ncbi:hypothetical protein MMC21_007427 [Puttea exsequens]|nr:hypothetical protein [Puttea exsequens]
MADPLTSEAQSFAAETSHLEETIKGLQNDVARANDLEVENNRLASELKMIKDERMEAESATRWPSEDAAMERAENSPSGLKDRTISIDEYNRMRDSNDRAYGRLLSAHKITQLRLRYYKDVTRQWRDYTKQWILRDAEKRARKGAHDPSGSHSRLSTEGESSSSVPAPPILPEGRPSLTPSVSGISRSITPQQHGEFYTKESPKIIHALNKQTKTLEVLTDEITATQTAHSRTNGADGGDSTTSSDESELISEDVNAERTATNLSTDHMRNIQAPAAAHDGGSSLVIASERSLKRKRPAKSSQENKIMDKGSNGTSKRSALKREQLSSSPLHSLPILPPGLPEDSMDLDDVGDRLDTPRKNLRREALGMQSSMLQQLDAPDDAMLERSWTAPGEDSSKAGNAQVEDERQNPTKHNDRNNPRSLAATKTASLVFKGSKTPSAKGYPTPTTTGSNGFGASATRREEQQRQFELASPILRPTENNSHLLPRNSETLARDKRPCPPSRRDRGEAYVPALAEDGEDSGPVNPRKKGDSSLQTSMISLEAADAHHRLGHLLNDPTPTKVPSGAVHDNLFEACKFKTPVNRATALASPRSAITYKSMPAKRVEPKDIYTLRSSPDHTRNSPGKDRSSSAKALDERSGAQSTAQKPPPLKPSETRPEQEPLRARPLNRLNLEDFRLNPAHSDYAYHETIRKHDEKRAIGGCTLRNCSRCKDLRKFVQNSGYTTLRKIGESPEEANERLLLDFLGGDHRRLKRMSTDEKVDMLMQAKIREFADKHGKHRQMYSRAKTPPGMWNVDFPTTQEEVENREAARKIEREKVEERFFEALRPGGRYVFADEVR